MYTDEALIAVNIWPHGSPEHSIASTTASCPAMTALLHSLASKSPIFALYNAEIAGLFAHYISVLAPWYDLNDPQSTFAFVVPEAALEEPILFKAIIAFSAGHLHQTTGTHGEAATIFHAACVTELLYFMSIPDVRPQGAELAATCLLRSYELINGRLLLSSMRWHLTLNR
jgi:hypothetical protein